MIYPQKLYSKQGEKIIMIFLLSSVIIGLIFIVVNKLTNPEILWAGFANCGIIYILVIVILFIKRNTNIAGHVLLQMIIILMVAIYIDEKLGFKGWSVNIAIPIILIVANITMLILTIISHNKYLKYAIYQLIIVLITIILIILNIKDTNILGISAGIVSIFNLVISLTLNFNDMKEAIIRKFHM